MLTLFHWEANAASARVLLTLCEKRLDFAGDYVDVLAFEQFGPGLSRHTGEGQVPVLVVETGATLTDSSFICEYLDEARSNPPLMPADAFGRWRVREWQKYVDDHLAPAVSRLAWQAGLPAFQHALGERAATAVEAIPLPTRRDAWREALAGSTPERLGAALDRLREGVRKAEQDLARGPWLAGDVYSLADIAAFSYLNYLTALLSPLNALSAAPRVAAWLERVAGRPAVAEALSRGRQTQPFTVAAPGPESIRWG